MYSKQLSPRPPPTNSVTCKALLLTNSQDLTSQPSSSNSPKGTGLTPCHSRPQTCAQHPRPHTGPPQGPRVHGPAEADGATSPEWDFGPSRGVPHTVTSRRSHPDGRKNPWTCGRATPGHSCGEQRKWGSTVIGPAPFLSLCSLKRHPNMVAPSRFWGDKNGEKGERTKGPH